MITANYFPGFSKLRTIPFFALALLGTYGCNSPEENKKELSPAVPIISYKEIDRFFHDTSLFTEGFLIHNGQLYESTGSPDTNTRSLIGISDLATGKFLKKIELNNKEYFGEGIIFLKGKLYQLTYKNQMGFIYDANTFKLIGKFTYRNKEGWGMTTDGNVLVMSDGTDSLTFLDPDSLKPTKYLQVTENGIARDSLNELEFIKGFIYANIWRSNYVVKINPADGKVVGKIDFSSLAIKTMVLRPNADVLNGIAYDSVSDNLYITGKFWPYIYQIKFTP